MFGWRTTSESGGLKSPTTASQCERGRVTESSLFVTVYTSNTVQCHTITTMAETMLRLIVLEKLIWCAKVSRLCLFVFLLLLFASFILCGLFSGFLNFR